jgi:hypothetical protein
MARTVFLIGFILILWLPMIQMVTGVINVPALNENRARASVPVLGSWETVDVYASDAVKWFNDHFGFRDFLIQLKTQIDYSVFGMSTRIHIGDDGWLFYRSVMDVQKPMIEGILRTDADAVVEGTRQLANALAERGVRLVIMVAPMKDIFYSQHLPNTVHRLPLPRQVDIVQDRLRSMKEIIFLDSTAILRDVVKQRDVFHRTDFHWNDPAAFEVARSLVDRLGQSEGRTSPVWTHALEIEEKVFSGGEAIFMPLFFPPSETGLFIKQSWVLPPFSYVENQGPLQWVFEFKEPTPEMLPPIAVMGDSFFDAMVRSGFGMYFQKIYKADWNKVTLKTVIDNLPPDTHYLFLEFIEVSVPGFNGLISFAR